MLPTTPVTDPPHDTYPPAWRTPRTGDRVVPSTSPAETASPLAGGDCGARENPSLKPGEQGASKSKPATTMKTIAKKTKPQRGTEQQKQEQNNHTPMDSMTLETEQRHIMATDFVILCSKRDTDVSNFLRQPYRRPGGSLALSILSLLNFHVLAFRTRLSFFIVPSSAFC